MKARLPKIFLAVILAFGVFIAPYGAAPRAQDREEENMDIQLLFEGLKATRADAYIAYREAWTARKEAAAKFLANKEAAGKAWQGVVQKEILEGWSRHETLYRSVLKKIEEVDVTFQTKTCGGMASIYGVFYRLTKTEYLGRILPLCWESVLKFDGTWPDWKIMTFLHMMRALPDKLSVEPAFHALCTSDSKQVRETAAEVLSELPRDQVKARLAPLIEKHRGIAQLLEEIGED